MSNGGRELVRVWLSAEARGGLNRFVRGQAITLTGFLEVIGQRVASQANNGLDDLSEPLRELVLEARQMDARRRRRRGEPTPP